MKILEKTGLYLQINLGTTKIVPLSNISITDILSAEL